MSAPCRCPHCPPSPTVAGSELSSWGKQPGPLSPGATDPQKGCLFRVRPGENARLTLEQGNKLEERLTRNRTRPPDPNQNSRTAPPPPRTRAVPKGWGPLVAPSPWVVFPRTHPRKSPAATFPPKLGSQGQHPRTVRGGRGHRGRPGWVPPETVAGVPKVASWVSARSWGMRGEGIDLLPLLKLSVLSAIHELPLRCDEAPDNPHYGGPCRMQRAWLIQPTQTMPYVVYHCCRRIQPALSGAINIKQVLCTYLICRID